MAYRRRYLLLSAAVDSVGRVFGKDNFWTKQTDRWSDKEVHQLLTKSPWAEVSAQFGNSGQGGPPMMGGGAEAVAALRSESLSMGKRVCNTQGRRTNLAGRHFRHEHHQRFRP